MSKEAMKQALEALEKLWDIIDDIDTYGDMAKSDDKLYRSLVERRQRQRFEQTGISTDGYELNGGAITALRQAIAEAEKQELVRMRMPKVGDRVICLEDETLGTVKYLTAGGSPEIKFDDGSYGTYLLREFAELFVYAAPVHASDMSQERVYETAKGEHEPVAWMWKDGSLTSDPDEADGTWIKLYTAPPKRKWVGLTEEELEPLCDLWKVSYGSVYVDEFARAIEAKLKEKNGG